MYSIHLHRHNQSLLSNIDPSRAIHQKNQLSLRAYHRIDEWKSRNTELVQSVYGKVTKRTKFPRLRQISQTPDHLIPAENPYSESEFNESLRKTEKSKHLGKYFIRVKYLSTQERMNLSMYSNSYVDVCPPKSPGKEKVLPTTVRKVKDLRTEQKSNKKDGKWTPDPFFDPCNEKIFRQRQKSLEPAKAFFVTTKVPPPKSNLLISKKFSEFYNSLNGKKLYKNSIDEIFRA